MIRLARYTRPYLGQILLSIALLFIQANFDLALPDYLSRMVNIGLQQNGVENAVPLAIRRSQMERLALFMSAGDRATVLEAYALVDSTAPEYQADLARYPALAEGAIYVLKDDSAAEIDRLNPLLGRPLLAVSALEQALADPAQAAKMDGLDFDLSKLPPGMDLWTVLGQLPAAQREQLSARVNAQFSALGDKTIVQAAALVVRSEYAALGMDVEQLQNDYILNVGGWMLLITLAAAVCTIVVGFLSARTAAGMARDIRRDVFQKVESFASAEFDRFSTASLITRSTNDITQIQMVVVMLIRMVFYAPIIGVGGIIRVVGQNSAMTGLIAVAVMTLIGLILTVFAVALPRFKRIQDLVDRLNLVARENLSGLLVVRAFNMQPFEAQRFDRANRDLADVSLFINRVMVVMLPLMMLVMNAVSLAILWVGARQVAAANMQVGDMMAFLQYAMQIMMAFLMLSMMFIILPRASVSADRIAEVLETEPAIQDPPQPRRLPEPFQGLVEFRNVSFRYPGAEEDALHDLSFTARPGQTTGLIGATGAGKSTVVNLIPRFYDVTGGAILLDGVDIRQVSQHDLRAQIGYVPQKSVLFSGTIQSNLRYADEAAAPERLQWSADIAQASEFIQAKPEGLAAEIAQGGANVSGGQKQRLAIARALVKQPPIYIFDDSFSALDFKTDAALRRALRQHTGGSTLLIVTQRVSTIRYAEQILVLDEGRLVGRGTHAELMQTCDIYREIALSQLSQEALA